MIYLTVIGRCGNQMFQYAFARRIAEIQRDNITINFGQLHNYSVTDRSTYVDELSQFYAVNSFKKIITQDDMVLRYGSLKQKLVYRLYRGVRKIYGRLGKNPHNVNSLFRSVLSSVGIFIDTPSRQKKFKLKKVKERNIFIRGYFEELDYFQTIKDIICQDFMPIQHVSNRNALLLEQIKNSNSVCVSFRKWDVGGRDICGEDYYKKAFAYFQRAVDNPVFVVFSNDVDWVKEHFTLPPNCIYETGNNPTWEKVLLMSSCKHFIITNSTFAWWVQYLGREENKVVVSPIRWFESQTAPDTLFLRNFVEV